MIKILHTADLHLDSPFEALPDNLAMQRRHEQRELLERIVALATREGVQILLLAGDLLDSDSAYFETSRLLEQVFSNCKAQVFIAPGNHDYYTGSSPYARLVLPENVHIFRSEAIECVELPELNCRVWGAGFVQKDCPPLLEGFVPEKSDGTVDIMLLHGAVGSAASPYNPIGEQAIERSGMDYVALGHVHSYSGLLSAGETHYAYPGCPEGRGFDECGEKGVILVEIGQDRLSAKFVPVCMRKYESISVDISGDDDAYDKTKAALTGDTSRDIYRIILTGECEIAPKLSELEEKLAPLFFSLQLRDSTRPAQDIWARSGEDTLRGLFLARLKTRFGAAQTAEEKEKISQAVRFGLAAMDEMEEPYI